MTVLKTKAELQTSVVGTYNSVLYHIMGHTARHNKNKKINFADSWTINRFIPLRDLNS